jgi:hypothetical protein
MYHELYAFLEFQVSPFTAAFWRIPPDGELSPLPPCKDVSLCVRSITKNVLILALARCSCAIVYAYTKNRIGLPTGSLSATRYWSSTSVEEAMAVDAQPYRERKKLKFFEEYRSEADKKADQEEKVCNIMMDFTYVICVFQSKLCITGIKLHPIIMHLLK